jgi:hypothetical protein
MVEILYVFFVNEQQMQTVSRKKTNGHLKHCLSIHDNRMPSFEAFHIHVLKHEKAYAILGTPRDFLTMHMRKAENPHKTCKSHCVMSRQIKRDRENVATI